MNDIVSESEFALSMQLERNTVEKLTVILQQEQDALVEGEDDRLETFAFDKTELLRHLAGLAEKRNRHLASRGLIPDREGMEAWLADNADAKILAAWRDSLRFAKTAQQINQTNGEMLVMRQQHNQQALAVLLGAADASALYGPKGLTSRFSGRRPLGQV